MSVYENDLTYFLMGALCHAVKIKNKWFNTKMFLQQ